MPYEKFGDNEPVCIADEVPFDIPDSWEWVRLGTIIELQSGQDLTPDKYNSLGKGIPYITGASNIEDGTVIINRWTEYARAFANKDDLLITCKGTVGTMAILKEDYVHIARQIMGVKSFSGIHIKYLQLVLETLVAGLKASAKSMIPGISRDDVLFALAPIPPYVEQERILEVFCKLIPSIKQYSYTSSILNVLNKSFPEQLKKSILQQAIMGKLVPQDPNDEPASVLLERIRAEKEQLIKDKKIKKDKHESIIYKRDNSHYEKIDGVERCINDELPFDIPDSWAWVRLGTLFQHNTGKALNSSNKNGNMMQYITTSNLYWGRFELDNIKEMPFTNAEVEKCTVKYGDLLVCEGGDIGRTAIWCYDYPMRIQNHIHRLRPYINVFIELYYYILYFYKHAGLIGGKGIGIQGLSSKVLHTLLIPLPPYNEQIRIVENIKMIIPQIDKL